MNFQQKQKFLDFLEAAEYGILIASTLGMISGMRNDEEESEFYIAAGLGFLGSGIISALYYKTEVSMYGFSPSFQLLKRK